MDIWRYSLSFDSAIEFEELKREGLDFLKDHANEVGDGFVESVNDVYSLDIHNVYDFNLSRTEILDSFEDVFDHYDAILSPVSLCLPVKNASQRGKTLGPTSINGVPVDPTCGFATTYLVNFIGYPAASVPAGLSKEGLPIGMHIIAPKYKDGLVLAIADKIEQLLPWRNLYPKL
jgi:amidase/aspartyl-tRNA(Asn)/glutamyl-tRNA(Gln) amidotransferase subunit A